MSHVASADGPLPYRDAQAGIAFGKGGLRGIYQAGVVHALVLSGYYPGTVAGTSIGALTGTILAAAGECDRQKRRLELLEAYLCAWERNPGQWTLEQLLHPDGGLAALASDLFRIDLSLEELVTALSDVGAGRPFTTRAAAAAKLLTALPLHRPRVGIALARATAAWLHTRVARVSSMNVPQAVLDVYGLRQSLIQASPLDAIFGELLETFLPAGGETRFSDLTRTDLVFQVANLSRREKDEATMRLETLGASPPSGRSDRSRARLVAALRAACAFAPLYPPVRMGSILDTVAPPSSPDDVLMDAGVVENDALAPVISHWARQHRRGPFRLFTVYHTPLGDMPAPGTSSFMGNALHSLNLLDGLDLEYNAAVTELISELVDAIEARPGTPMPTRPGGGRYVSVRLTPLAPETLIPFGVISAPSTPDMLEACAQGCRSTLQALHAGIIGEVGDGRPVPCPKVLEAARRAHRFQHDEERDDFFRPIDRVCAHCTRVLSPPAQLEPQRSSEEIARANDFEPFHEDRRPPAPADPTKPKPLTVVVPAGGVFLGVFQMGAIAALTQYGAQPELYAGASVGTLFSYLLDTCLEKASALEKMVELARTIPEWVDAVPNRPAGTPGVIDALMQQLGHRWRSPELAPLREMRLAEFAAVFGPPEQDGRTDALWRRFANGLDALLFTPIPNRRTGAPRALPARYHLEGSERKDLRQMLCALATFRLADALPLLDDIAANLDCFEPGPRAAEGEVLGVAGIEQALRSIVFGTADPTLEAYSRERRARFVFTVTNHTRGRAEYFGYDDERAPARPSPLAVQAMLAASSFPLVFRRRSWREIFGSSPPEDADIRFADGGIFNNFPSDTAFAYLHRLSGEPPTRWLGGARHQMLLLSLTSPQYELKPTSEGDRLLFLTLRAYALSEDEKVEKTLRIQQHINRLAAVANPLLKENGRKQAIMADLDLISPAYAIYRHPFAFKPEFGFEEEKQLEMFASGCRRARIALEWRRYQEEHGMELEADAPVCMGSSSPGAPGERLRRTFQRAVRDEVRRTLEATSSSSDRCIFGAFTPAPPTGAPPGCVCPFARTMRPVYQACRDTIDRELEPADWKLPVAMPV